MNENEREDLRTRIRELNAAFELEEKRRLAAENRAAEASELFLHYQQRTSRAEDLHAREFDRRSTLEAFILKVAQGGSIRSSSEFSSFEIDTRRADGRMLEIQAFGFIYDPRDKRKKEPHA